MPNGVASLVLNALISAIIGSGVGTIVALYTKRDEIRFASELAKQRALWDARFGSVRELKRTAGYLHEHLCGHAVEQQKPSLYAKLGELNILLSDFAEREDVARAIRDFHHAAAVRLAEHDEGTYYDNFEQRVQDMQAKFAVLVQAAETYLNPPVHTRTKARGWFLDWHLPQRLS